MPEPTPSDRDTSTTRLLDVATLTQVLRRFAEERDWGQFHTPRNLTLALGGEVGELMELLQWRSDAEITALLADTDQGTQLRNGMSDELADVLIHLCRLADVCSIDLAQAVAHKVQKNKTKYPATIVRGSAAKYTEYVVPSEITSDAESPPS